MSESHEYDLVVIGTGWYGLVAAKVYIEMHPTEKILVLEASGSCGGTWSEDRLYPGLKSNNLLDSYEYPDLSMANYGVKPGQHIPGTVLHKYLTDFAKKFGVFERVQFNTKVDRIEPLGNGWKLTASPNSKSPSSGSTFTTRKVILATGLTSTPNMPSYKGAETFAAPLFHAKDFCRQGHTVETSKNAVVVGGAKSAYDVAYAYVVNGCQVDLVIRPTGNGPVWISRPWVMGGGKRLDKLLQVRWMTWFSPGPFAEIGAWPRSLLHRTAVGRWIVDKFWGALAGDVVQLNGYNGHPELKKLHPWNAAFWIGSGLSIHNYDSDFFDMIKDGRIKVHIADVDHLSEKTVHLTTGESLKADVLVCSTGWKKEPAIEFANFGEAGIGLPHSKAEQKQLAAEYDRKVLDMFPRLKDQPTLQFTPKEDPYRLYRFMVPPTFMRKRNIALAGMVSTVTTSMLATVQAVWISAFLDGNLDREAKTEQEITDEIMLHTQWGKWRHPTGYGATLPDMVFDGLPFADTLLGDLGLTIKRKPSLLKEYTEPYAPTDYIGLVDEWKQKHPGLVKQ